MIGVEDLKYSPSQCTIQVINTFDEWNAHCESFKKSLHSFKVVGFDCEWTNSNPLSLIQLCNQHGLCLLVRVVNLIKSNCGHFPESLVEIFSDRNIIKTGVGVLQDARKIESYYGVQVRGCVDLRLLLLKVGVPNIKPQGLEYLSKELLNVTLKKDFHVRCGDWDVEELSDEQKEYAAMDSFISLKIFQKLIDINKKNTLLKSNNYITAPNLFDSYDISCLSLEGSSVDGDIDSKYIHGSEVDSKVFQKKVILHCKDASVNIIETNSNEESCGSIDMNEVVTELCFNITDIKFKEKHAHKTNKNKKVKNIKENSSITPKNNYSRALQGRKKPLYDNCLLCDCNGTPLTTCDSRKVKWYLDKNLAEKISDDPVKIKLLFETAARPLSGDGYYLQNKENVCVVCGACDSYHRKNIIPREYRKHFPVIFKDHKSHDVILLCTSCHHRSTQHDSLLKHSLSLQYDAPIRSDKYQQSFLLTKAKSAVKAVKGKHKIPQERMDELMAVLKEFYKEQNDIDTENKSELIEFVHNFEDSKTINPHYEEHGRRVVAAIGSDKHGLINFEKMWRQHFLDTMQPRFLPTLWSVDHCHDILNEIVEN